MNRQQFSDLLKNPDGVLNDASGMLEELVKRYPYCQTGQILYTYKLYREGHLQYHTQLKKAAAYAGDRRRLKALIESASPAGAPFEVKPLPETPSEAKPTPGAPAETTPTPHANSEPTPLSTTVLEPTPPIEVPAEPTPSHRTIAETAPPPDTAEKFTQTEEEVPPSAGRTTREELLAIVRKRLAEIEGQKNQGKAKLEEPPVMTKEAIIERFILEEPQISRPKTNFFSPTDVSQRSNMDEEEIVSETLAQLYAKQGNIAKATHIYEKLSLVNPEKSRYFAAQIQQLKH